MNKEEIKNEFINCIEGSHTLNLAISVLEDRELLQNNWNELKKWLNEYRKNKDILVPVAIVKLKMQELEGKNE